MKKGKWFILPVLTRLLNVMFDTGYFPIEWSKSIIIPLFKKGDSTKADNYRGISLSSILSKVYTKILNTRLRFWADAGDVISEAQAGFRANYSTLYNVFTLHTMIHRNISKIKGRFYCAFVDFSKAFDYLVRDKMLKLLEKKGVSGSY